MFGLLGYLGALSLRADINAHSKASNPACVRISHDKLRRLCPSLYFSSGVVGSLRCFFANGLEQRYVIKDIMLHGDSRAARVLSTTPLLVAAYCDDLDGVCVLRFEDALAHEYGLQSGDRLLTVLNSWSVARPVTSDYVASDIVQGDRANPRYVNFWPLIADFLSDDVAEIKARKGQISAAEFERCYELGQRHQKKFPGLARQGRPDRSMRVAGQPLIKFQW